MKTGKTILSLAFCLVASSGAQAAFTLTSTEDNNVLRSAATTVQGDGQSTSFSVKEATSVQSNSRIGFVKFDLTGQTPTVLNDNALFTVSLSSSAGTTFSLKAFALNAGAAGFDWSESTITWDTRPAAGFSSTNYVDTTLATETPVVGSADVASGAPAGTTFSFFLPTWEDYVQSDNSITFILLNTEQGNGNFSLSIASSENSTVAYRPTLESVPEPSAAALVALGALALLRRRITR